MKANIKSVKGLKIGQVFNYKGDNYIVKEFPSRKTVVGESQGTIDECAGKCLIRVPIKSRTLFYQNNGHFITPYLNEY